MIEEFLAYLERQEGVTYKVGGDDPVEGFSCSGLVCWGLRAFGLIEHSRHITCNAMAERFKNRIVTDAPRRGDLLLFGKPGDLTHCAVAVSGWQMIESSNGGPDPCVRKRPIGTRKDLATIVRIYGGE